jgi:hypothetical protein
VSWVLLWSKAKTVQAITVRHKRNTAELGARGEVIHIRDIATLEHGFIVLGLSLIITQPEIICKNDLGLGGQGSGDPCRVSERTTSFARL